MHLRHAAWSRPCIASAIAAVLAVLAVPSLHAQGVTTAAVSGVVTDTSGMPLENAVITAVHEPTGTTYRGTTRAGGAYTILNMRVGGPYHVTAALIGYQPSTRGSLLLTLGQTNHVDLRLVPQAVQVTGIEVRSAQDPVMNASRTGAAITINEQMVEIMPSVTRSTRDLTRLDPRSDGNYSFGGRNWLYNNITVDGSYYNNSFGLDDPAPGGQAGSEPIPFDAVEQVQVAIAPFDVRQSGFTGANVNLVTRSGTNDLRVTAYGFGRNNSFQGNSVGGQQVSANPSLSYSQAGFSVGGPLMRDRLFLFVNAELERRTDPGSDFVACTTTCTGTLPLGVSRVRVSTMDSIRQRMIGEYNFDPGPYQNYDFATNNNKLLARLDWNINENNNLMIRYDYLSSYKDKGPHPFVLSYANAGRGPNSSTLPFRNSGYRMNNGINSLALELNSRSTGWANRLFASFNARRDHRDAFSGQPFPTIEIGENGVGYTTVGEEPFSIHNILNTNEIQVVDEYSRYFGRHTTTVGASYERFSFFNSFNIFRNGVFFLPYGLFPGTATFDSPSQFFTETDPNNPSQADFLSFNGSGPYKGEDIATGQISVYLQDEFLASPRLNLNFGLRLDMPQYYTTPVDNPFSRGLTAVDANGNPQTVDQSKLPGTQMMWSPRIGFNWNAAGDRATQVRGGTGVFTGRPPMVWVGNVISNPGQNPNLYPIASNQVHTGSPADSSILQTSFDVNAMAPNFKWPQVWTTDLAVDHRLPWQLLGTLEFIYTKDLNAIYLYNADLPNPTGTNPIDGRPTYASSELNADGGAGIYVIDNTSEGYSYNLTAQLRRSFGANLTTSIAYTYLQARNNLQSTEIASVLWQNQPVQGNPNKPELSYSQFGQTHRIVGFATYDKLWSSRHHTQFGLYLEVAQGNRYDSNRQLSTSRYSFIYSGDANGDGYGGNDLIYIPRNSSEIAFDTLWADQAHTTVASTPAQQWTAFDAFINQDSYLSSHRGQIAQRNGLVNPWYHELDLRIMHEMGVSGGHKLQLSWDILNLTNLLNSSWGVRKIADPFATSPLRVTQVVNGMPHVTFSGATHTFMNNPNEYSRWQMQFGIRYLYH